MVMKKKMMVMKKMKMEMKSTDRIMTFATTFGGNASADVRTVTNVMKCSVDDDEEKNKKKKQEGDDDVEEEEGDKEVEE